MNMNSFLILFILIIIGIYIAIKILIKKKLLYSLLVFCIFLITVLFLLINAIISEPYIKSYPAEIVLVIAGVLLLLFLPFLGLFSIAIYFDIKKKKFVKNNENGKYFI